MRDEPDRKTAGSCLCGGIAFEIAGSFDSFFLCHCSRCRKDTGSAHAANMFSATARITWFSGQDLIRTYRLPSTRHQRSFCAICGSAVPGLQFDGALLVVPAGSLDGIVDRLPDAHICFGSRASWDRHGAPVPTIDGLPG